MNRLPSRKALAQAITTYNNDPSIYDVQQTKQLKALADHYMIPMELHTDYGRALRNLLFELGDTASFGLLPNAWKPDTLTTTENIAGIVGDLAGFFTTPFALGKLAAGKSLGLLSKAAEGEGALADAAGKVMGSAGAKAAIKSGLTWGTAQTVDKALENGPDIGGGLETGALMAAFPLVGMARKAYKAGNAVEEVAKVGEEAMRAGNTFGSINDITRGQIDVIQEALARKYAKSGNRYYEMLSNSLEDAFARGDRKMVDEIANKARPTEADLQWINSEPTVNKTGPVESDLQWVNNEPPTGKSLDNLAEKISGEPFDPVEHQKWLEETKGMTLDEKINLIAGGAPQSVAEARTIASQKQLQVLRDAISKIPDLGVKKMYTHWLEGAELFDDIEELSKLQKTLAEEFPHLSRGF